MHSIPFTRELGIMMIKIMTMIELAHCEWTGAVYFSLRELRWLKCCLESPKEAISIITRLCLSFLHLKQDRIIRFIIFIYYFQKKNVQLS